MSDTVGFIQDLPHDLVPAFAATLETARTADLLLHVVDVSKPSWEADVRAVMDTLESEVFQASEKRPPIMIVPNKVDLHREGSLPDTDGIPISAKLGTHVDRLREAIAERLFPKSRLIAFTLPHRAQYTLHPFASTGRARIVGYEERGVQVEAVLSADEWHLLEAAGAEANASASSPAEER
jgi:GTP-binding protein HflX